MRSYTDREKKHNPRKGTETSTVLFMKHAPFQFPKRNLNPARGRKHLSYIVFVLQNLERNLNPARGHLHKDLFMLVCIANVKRSFVQYV